VVPDILRRYGGLTFNGPKVPEEQRPQVSFVTLICWSITYKDLKEVSQEWSSVAIIKSLQQM